MITRLVLYFFTFFTCFNWVNCQYPNDKNVLAVYQSISKHAFCMKNPLFGSSPTKVGVYDFWVKTSLSVKQYKTLPFVDFSDGNGSFLFTLWLQYYCNDYGCYLYSKVDLVENNVVKTNSWYSQESWNHVTLAWVQNQQNVTVRVNYWTVYNATLSTSKVHPSKICLLQLQYQNSTPTYLGEFKFWSVPLQEYTANFYDRFYKIEMKSSGWVSPWIVDYYQTQPKSAGDTWSAALNPAAYYVTLAQSNIIKWDKYNIADCTMSCPMGWYWSYTNMTCLQCNSDCYECAQMYSLWQHKCYNCSTGYFSNNYTCIKADCPVGMYFDSATQSCFNCVSPCSTCKDATSCYYCKSGFNYVDDNSTFGCVASSLPCPAGTVKDPVYPICRECPSSCLTCLSTTQCTTCIDDTYILYEGKCIRQCPAATYLDSTSGTNQCVNCSSNCLSCNYNKCGYCAANYFLNSVTNLCVSTCPTGTYADSISRSCMICQVNCDACSTNNYTCSACKSGYFLLGTACVPSCPYEGYFHNTVTRKCDACNTACKVCIANATDCIDCQPGVFYSNRKCMNACPLHYFSALGSLCYPCDNYCDTCFGSLNTMCLKCNPNYYLQSTTCETTCPPASFGNSTSWTCDSCAYFCSSCTSSSNCQVCKPGYKIIPSNCSGEYFFKSSSTKYMTLPFNPDTMPLTLDPTALTVEIWFKADNINSNSLEVIVGASPYKLRKKSGTNSVQVNFQGILNFCDTPTTMTSDTWYHFAFALNEVGGELTCYLDGVKVALGGNPGVLVATNVLRPTELTLAGTLDPRGAETKFSGYIKEFRLWNVARSAFAVNGFKNIAFDTVPNSLISYWRLDEKNDGTFAVFKDSAGAGTTIFDPTISTPAFDLKSTVEMREIYLKMCPEGQYSSWSIILGYYECLPCHEKCKNCVGPTASNCTDCYLPKKLLQEAYACVDIDSCPDGYYMDPVTQLCFQCNTYCLTCVSWTMCTSCKTGSFKEFQGTSCVNSCPEGMYGHYQQKICKFNPIITSITPLDGSIFNYGTFIDAIATYEVLNNEPRSTYTYGWNVTRLSGSIDISQDIAKPYYDTDILKVHLDNNVLQPNNYYKLGFYVKGLDQYYKNMFSFSYNEIYIGIPPKNGICNVWPLSGFATVTKFNLTQKNWQDEEQLTKYDFFFSFDGGDIYVPIPSSNISSNTLNFTFDSIYSETLSVKIKCKVTNIKGFSNQALTTISLQKKSGSDAVKDLQKMSTTTLQTEPELLAAALKLQIMTQNIGSMETILNNYFDPKLEAIDCTSQTCGRNGACVYRPYTKKYFCNCTEGYGGQNCTFSNVTYIEMLQNLTQNVTTLYSTLLDKEFEFEFLRLTSVYKEQLTDTSYGILVSIMNSKLSQWQGLPQTNTDLQNYLTIISNFLEYIDYDILKNNVTGNWQKDTQKIATVTENLEFAMMLFDKVRANSLQQVNMLVTSFSFITRMIAYKQLLITQDSFLFISATNSSKKAQQTMVRLSPANFINQSLPLEYQFIAEAIEFAINPYQIVNTHNLSNNVYETTFYNLTNHLKADVENLTNGLDFYFPYVDNQNLTSFVESYMALSPYKAAQKLKRAEMLKSSQLGCNFWSDTNETWSQDGCKFSGLDTTHVRCTCSHLTSFAPQFYSPNLNDGGYTSNSNQDLEQNTDENDGPIELDELLVPMENYVKSLQELLQHKQPDPISLMLKPGMYLVIIFWFLYCTSMVFYSGKDRLRRYKMTKSQNRDDLAEIKDNEIQCLEQVIRDLLIRDQALNAAKVQQKNVHQINEQDTDAKLPDEYTEKPIIYDELPLEDKKAYKRRARRKVFGKVGSICQRARRFYKRTYKKDTMTSETKMKFFNEEIKNNLWFGLMAKTSKIAPRHVRLTLMYFYTALHLLISTGVMIFGYQQKLEEIIGDSMFSNLAFATMTILGAQVIAMPVALTFRMPMSIRGQIEGVKTKKINKVFIELDRQMGWRYAIGYFICLLVYCTMTLAVCFFNYFYPQSYCMSWLTVIILIIVLDMIVFTFGFAGLQLLNSLLSLKVSCFYWVWATFEIFRYAKNLRG